MELLTRIRLWIWPIWIMLLFPFNGWMQYTQVDLKAAAKMVAIERRDLALNAGFVTEADSIVLFLNDFDQMNCTVIPDTLSNGFFPLNPTPVSQNPHFLKVIAAGTAFLQQTPVYYPKATAGTSMFSDLNVTRSLVDRLQECHWLLTCNESPYYHHPELFKRYLRLLYAISDDYYFNYTTSAFDAGGGSAPGQSSGDWFSTEVADCWRAAYVSFGDFMPDNLKNRFKQCAGIMGTRSALLCNSVLPTAGYANRDIYYALGLYACGLFLNNESWKNTANLLINHVFEDELLPDGAFHYIGNQNECPTYHGWCNKGLLAYYRLSRFHPALQSVARTKNWEVLSTEQLMVPEYYTSPAWKTQWNTVDGVSARALATISGDPLLKTFYRLRQSILGFSDDLMSGAYYIPYTGNLSTALPNNYQVYDRNIVGIRVRNDDYSFAIATRPVSIPGNVGLQTYVGAMATQSTSTDTRALNSALMLAHAKVHVAAGNSTEWDKWAYLNCETDAKLSMSKKVSGFSSTSRLYRQLSGPSATASNWNSFQEWLTFDDRMVGYVEVTPKDLLSQVAYQIDGRVRMGYGRSGILYPQIMNVLIPGVEYTYGKFRIIIHQHNFTTVDTVSAGVLRDSPLQSKEIRFRYDLSNNGLNAVTYPGTTKKFYLVEIRPIDESENITVQKYDSLGVKGIIAYKGSNCYSLWRNTSPVSRNIDLEAYVESENMNVVFNERDSIQNPEPVSLTTYNYTLPANSQRLVISSASMADIETSWDNYTSLVLDKPAVTIYTANEDNRVCNGSQVIVKNVKSNVTAGSEVKWFVNNIFYSSNTDSIILNNISGAQNILCRVYFMSSGNEVDSVSSYPLRITSFAKPALNSAMVTFPGSVYEGCNLNVSVTQQSGAAYYWQGPDNYRSEGRINTFYNVSQENAGVYKIYIEKSGCASDTVYKTLAVLPFPNPVISGQTSICNNNPVYLSVNVLPNASISWFDGGTYAGNSNPLVVYDSGFYKVNVTMGGCVKSSENLNIMLGTAPDASITAGGSTTFCVGGSVVLNANTGLGLSYQWQLNGSNISGATSASYTASASGSYTVVVSQNGCSATSSATVVTVNTLPIASITTAGSTTFCAGSSLLLNANTGGGLTYQWKYNGNNIQNATNMSYSAMLAGSYSVKVTNLDGCSNTSNNLNISVQSAPPAPGITVGGSSSVCQGETVVLTSLSANGNVWSNGSTSNSIVVANSGLYSVHVVSNGCASPPSNVYISVNEFPEAEINVVGDTIFCEGESVSLNASFGEEYSYQWLVNGTHINGANSSNYVASAEGLYTVKVTRYGCSSTSAPTVVTVKQIPDVSINSMDSINLCSGESILLNATNNTNFSYQWLRDGVEIPNATTAVYSVDNTGSYSVSVVQNGCVANSTPVNVNMIPSQAISLGTTTNPTGCNSLNGSIQINGTGHGSISWNGASSGVITDVSLPFTLGGLNSGMYVIQMNASGCISNILNCELINPNAPEAVITTAENPSICLGETIDLYANTGSGLSYQWKLNGSNIPGATSVSYTANMAGSYSVEVSQNGCSAISSVIVITVNEMPIASITNGNSISFCPGSSVVLNANTGSGLSYQWKLNGLDIAGATMYSYTAFNAGVYSVEVIQNNCSVNSPATVVSMNALPTASITAVGSTTFCAGDSVILSVNGDLNFGYQWRYNGESMGIGNHELTASETGIYDLLITGQNGCTDESESISVTVNPKPDVQFNLESTVFCEESQPLLLNQGTPLGGIYTGNGISGGFFVPNSVGVGMFYITYNFVDSNSCAGSETITLQVEDCAGTLELQDNSFNVFPNPTDGIVYIQLTEIKPGKLAVLDNNGKLIFEREYTDEQSIVISMDNLENGVYWLYLESCKLPVKIILLK